MSHPFPKPISRAFFSQLFDYAGLFPPAALSIEKTIENYLRYRTGERAWILGRLILQAPHLHALAELLPPDEHHPLPLSLVTKAPRPDLESAARSLFPLKGLARLESVEVRLDSVRPVRAQLAEIHDAVEAFENVLGRPNVFIELPPEHVPSQVTLLLREMKSSRHGSAVLGYKLRCGGLPGGAPAPSDVAAALHSCAAEEVPLKFTAGLHHPFPDIGIDDAAHGFMNVLFAAFVANAFGAPRDSLESILSASPPSLPEVQDDSISWFGFTLNSSAIAELRASRVVSIGSCNFREPTDDAAELGWLPASKSEILPE